MCDGKLLDIQRDRWTDRQTEAERQITEDCQVYARWRKERKSVGVPADFLTKKKTCCPKYILSLTVQRLHWDDISFIL